MRLQPVALHLPMLIGHARWSAAVPGIQDAIVLHQPAPVFHCLPSHSSRSSMTWSLAKSYCIDQVILHPYRSPVSSPELLLLPVTWCACWCTQGRASGATRSWRVCLQSSWACDPRPSTHVVWRPCQLGPQAGLGHDIWCGISCLCCWCLYSHQVSRLLLRFWALLGELSTSCLLPLS